MSSINSKPGVTLLEMIIVMILALGLLSAVIMAYSVTLRSYTGGLGRAALLDNANGALEKMAKDIRFSRQVVTAQPGRLSLWSADLNGDYQIQANELITYEVQSGKLFRISSTESGWVTDLVRTLAVSPDAGARLVTLDLTLANGGLAITLEAKAKVRNAPE